MGGHAGAEIVEKDSKNLHPYPSKKCWTRGPINFLVLGPRLGPDSKVSKKNWLGPLSSARVCAWIWRLYLIVTVR